jgi:hypothetical protein
VTSDSVKRGRTPDQRVAVRFPPLAHAVAASVLRLPPGSRLRRSLVVRTARAGFEAWVRGDYDFLTATADPKVEVHLEQASGTGGLRYRLASMRSTAAPRRG